MSMQFSSIWPIDRVLSGATALGQSRPGSDGNEGVLRMPLNSSITETLPSYCLVSYLGYLLGGGLAPLQICSRSILQLQPAGKRSNRVRTPVTLLHLLSDRYA